MMPTGRTTVIGGPVPGEDADSPEGSGTGGSAWEQPPEAELEKLPPVEIHPWGDHALAVMLRSGARVMELRSALRFLPEDAVFEGVYGDVEFAVAFDIPHETKS
jgi:uncharacterized repeat protein (TIGR03917 family)